MCIYKLVHTYISSLCYLRGARSNDTPVTKSYLVPSSWFLIQHHNKRIWKKNIDSRTAVGNIQDYLGGSCSSKNVRKY